MICHYILQKMALTVGLPFLQKNKTEKKMQREEQRKQDRPSHCCCRCRCALSPSLSCRNRRHHCRALAAALHAPTLLCPLLTKSGGPKAGSGIKVERERKRVEKEGWAVVGLRGREDGGGAGFGYRAPPLRGADSATRRPMAAARR